MKVSKEVLKAQLLDYRKASRALMWYYDSSEKLYELITEALGLMDLSIEDGDLEEEVKDWDHRPKGVSMVAFSDVKTGANDWLIEYCTQNDFKMKRNSIYLQIYLELDIWPRNEPDRSLSGLWIYGYHVKNVKGNATDEYSDVEDNFNNKLIQKDSGIDGDGDPLRPMELKTFRDIWSAISGKYSGDYAAGLYDLADLVDEDAVVNTVIKDIGDLVKEWSS